MPTSASKKKTAAQKDKGLRRMKGKLSDPLAVGMKRKPVSSTRFYEGK